ncbi:unnamed protein product [Echinostoma caproni]|uniref:PDZ domain-containing protein n=1 Tax=Echinostoma caproni TaxID=27848 RepID=A0A183AWE5_9TREM|nr:unnamed protein product [Echinostoma caproni]
MKVSSPCGTGSLSTVQNNRFGANFVSPLQKATHREHATQSCSWLEQCYEVVVSAPSVDTSLSLPIDGGSDAGMFCVIGSQLDHTRLIQHHISAGNSAERNTGSPRQIQPGDIILALNEYEISGYTRRDAVELCDTLTRIPVGAASTPRRLRIRLSPPQALATGSTMLSSFLAAAFPLNSPEYSLQEKIRENVYQRVVPCKCF